jgi:AraC-like DNA-binding protein
MRGGQSDSEQERPIVAGRTSSSSQTRPLPRVRFSTADFPAGEGWDIWCEQIGEVFDVTLEAGENAAARVDVDLIQFDQLLFGAIGLSGPRQRGVRSARKARRDQLDHYVVELYTHGGNFGETPSGTFEAGTGSVNVTDMARPLTVVSGDAQSLTLTIPRPLLDAQLPANAGLHGLVLADGPGRFLADYLMLLRRQLPQLGEGDAAWVSQGTMAMVAACLAPSMKPSDEASAPVNAVLLNRVERLIESMLGHRQLSAQHLCAALGVSRSRLYRLFEPHGGVAQYIQSRRLEKIRAALLDPQDGRRISDLAYTYGFVSAAHFSRCFRRHFGYAPSDIRDLAGEERHDAFGPAPSCGRLFANWLRPPS